MANFKPMYWSKYIQTELEKDLVLANWCDYEFEGEFKHGNKLKVIGVARPTIQDYTPGVDLTAEQIKDDSQYLEITERKAFLIQIDKIDEVQAMPQFVETSLREAKTALAEEADKFVGKQAKDALTNMKSASTDISAETDPLATINAGLVKLYKNNVSTKTELAADLTPEHIVSIKSKLSELFTDNVEFIKRGAVGKYSNCYLRMSNNLYNDGTDDFEMIRTKKAIAYKGQIQEVGISQNPKGFEKYMKGLNVYGSKLMRPKELYVIRAH